eukprot:15451314-Alexandrium_andersonii.AAC.1
MPWRAARGRPRVAIPGAGDASGCLRMCERPTLSSSTSVLVESAKLGSSRCAGCATVAGSPRGQGRTPSTETYTVQQHEH